MHQSQRMTPTMTKRLFVVPLAVLKSLCIWGKQMLCLWSLPLCTVVSTSSRCPLPAARHVKVIHPTRLAADEGCLIDQGPINRLKKGRANEERDLPSPPSSRSHHGNLICPDVARTSAAQQLEINCRHYPPRWFMILVYLWRDLRCWMQ